MDTTGDGRNFGYTVINGAALPARDENYSLIVCGLARSGTTMVAGVLKGLGILCPDASNNEVLEDVALADSLARRDHAAAERIIRERDRTYGRWAVKRPDFYRSMPVLDRLLRRPRYIVTFRDIVAISVRNRLSAQQPVRAGLGLAALDLLALMNTIELSPSPMLLLSYEKAVLHREDAARAIAAFCGIEQPAQSYAELATCIVPEDPFYLSRARYAYEGRVEAIESGNLSGWVRCLGHAKPINIDIYLDGAFYKSFRAARLRLDLLAAGISDGRHGYRVPLPLDLASSATISVKVAESDHAIAGSGRTLADLSASAAAGAV